MTERSRLKRLAVAVSTQPPMENTAPNPLIDVRGLHVRFGKQQVLRDVSLQIPQGQTLVLIGESGCGKTVLLKSIIGLIYPTQGDIVFDGNSMSQLKDRELTQQRIRFGFVFQNAALFDSMTVAQNVAFPLKQHRQHSDAEIHEIVMGRLREVGLPDNVVRKKPAELSGGMRKRVGLARALALSPEVMLYDEPTTGLDPIMTDVINELIIRTRERYPVTSVVVTHDMRTVRRVADRVVMLYPLNRLTKTEPQVLYDNQAEHLEKHDDERVRQFVRGEAGARLQEMQRETYVE
ncbi:MAG: ABC transporter ATP-binding protein [Pirellulales bacterium]